MEEFTALIAWAAQALAAWRQANPILAEGVSFACRLLAPMLTLLILVRTIRSLLTVPAQPEVWAVLGLPNGVKVPLTRWENIMGRSPSADVVVNYPSVSRQHAAIIRRGDDADWTVYGHLRQRTAGGRQRPGHCGGHGGAGRRAHGAHPRG